MSHIVEGRKAEREKFLRVEENVCVEHLKRATKNHLNFLSITFKLNSNADVDTDKIL